jgi:hypothetical protein
MNCSTERYSTLTRSSNNHRTLEEPLQPETTTQCIGLSPTCAGSHYPGGPKASHALTFKLDHSSGAAHPEAPSFITRVCGSEFHIPRFRFGLIIRRWRYALLRV